MAEIIVADFVNLMAYIYKDFVVQKFNWTCYIKKVYYLKTDRKNALLICKQLSVKRILKLRTSNKG